MAAAPLIRWCALKQRRTSHQVSEESKSLPTKPATKMTPARAQRARAWMAPAVDSSLATKIWSPTRAPNLYLNLQASHS